MAAGTPMFYWGYMIVLSKFVVGFIDTGIAKSFGVLIPTMVERLDSDYATVGLICSLPSTLTFLLCPSVRMFLTKSNQRAAAMLGGLLAGSCIAACAFFKNWVATGICLTLTGAGLSMVYMPTCLSLNDYFPDKYVLVNTISLYGYTAGSVLLPVLMEKSLTAYGYYGAFLILGGVIFNSMVCAATLRKVPRNSTSNEGRDQIEPKDRKCFSGRNSSKKDATLGHNHGSSQAEDDDEEEEEESKEVPEQTSLIQVERGGIGTQEMSPESQSICIAGTFFQACERSCGVWKEPLFTFTIPIQILQSYTSYSWMLFLVPHAEQLGIPSSKAVYLSTVGGIGGIIGRSIFILLLSKRVNAFAVYILVGCVCAGSFLLDYISSDYRLRVAFAFIQGFSFFIEDAIDGSLCKEAVFDERNNDIAFANSSFWCGLGAAVAGTFTGYLFDITQSFTKVFIILGCIHCFMVGHLIIVAILIKRRR